MTQKPVANQQQSGSDRGRLGLVHVYTGEGKGKTTAALGLALRAAGQGCRVRIIQFLKARDTGELHSLPKLAPQVSIEQFGIVEFSRAGMVTPAAQQATESGLEAARRATRGGDYDLVILDEALVAAQLGVISVETLLDLMRGKAPQVELVLTGRGAPDEVIAEADLVTYMQEVKHPYHRGIPARRGIDY
ncbi:MAG: cob(I)yrinic acid a,c-diamide adenosyltransferase [Anaerolineae bacterium]